MHHVALGIFCFVVITKKKNHLLHFHVFLFWPIFSFLCTYLCNLNNTIHTCLFQSVNNQVVTSSSIFKDLQFTNPNVVLIKPIPSVQPSFFFRSRPYGVRCMTVGKWLLLKLSALKSKYLTLTIQNDSRFSATGFWQVFWL